MILVLASGSGTNFEAIAKAFPEHICGLICNNERAKVIEKAKLLNVKSVLIPHKNYPSRSLHEIKLVEQITQFPNLKIIVLAGYMRVLTSTFFLEIQNKFTIPPLIINLHPAPLELYKGAHAYEFALIHKFPFWGLSVHKVIPELDSGDILNYFSFPIFPYESIEELKNRIRPLEHKILIDTIHSVLFRSKETYDKCSL